MKKIKLMMVLILLLSMGGIRPTNQSYAAEPESVSLVPNMTSDTAPSGKVTSSPTTSGLHGYKAFDGIKNYSVAGDYTAWGINPTTGWLAYEFNTSKIVTKYVLYYGSASTNSPNLKTGMPNTWTFEGSNDGINWTELHSVSNYSEWLDGANTFVIEKRQPFSRYRINITKNNGATGYQVNLNIHELEIFGYEASLQPPTPEPTPPSGNRAILVVTMTTGLEKEYDLSMEEVNTFIDWYENRGSGTGSVLFKISKHDNNRGPFTNRNDYVIFDKVLTFEVSEY